MKKLISVIFSGLFILNILAYPVLGLTFSDVKQSHWAYTVISDLTDMGYIAGYPDKSFKPGNNITRAEFAAIMSKLANDLYPDSARYDNTKILTGMNSSHWAYNSSKQLLSHLSPADAARIFGNSFTPDKKITREEVVAVIYSILKQHADFSDIDMTKQPFTDLSKARFTDSIKVCVELGLIAGYPDNTFKPAGNITRAEIAAILVKVAKG